jgi:hypothetical protein
MLAVVTVVWTGAILFSRHPAAVASLPSSDTITAYATTTTDHALASIRAIFATDQ